VEHPEPRQTECTEPGDDWDEPSRIIPAETAAPEQPDDPVPPEENTSAAPETPAPPPPLQEQPEPSDEMEALPSEPEITSARVVEAILFAADEPITPAKLADIVGTGGVKEIKKIIAELNEKYERMDCSFRIESIAGGFQMLTLGHFNPWLRKLLKVRGETKLSPAALETLAIIAYKQPVMRVQVESIRGVGAGEMIRQLIEKGLVKIVGRAEELGRPLLYGTTRKFLEIFGLASLSDLPSTRDEGESQPSSDS